MRKWVACLSVLVLTLGFSAGVGAGPAAGEGHRIAISAAQAARVGLAVRHLLGNGRASIHVTDKQLALLHRMGIPYERVPMRTVSAYIDGNGNGKGKPVGGRTLPPTPVPYGIKMIYGDPGLQPAGIAGGETITVAVLDTGSMDHPDFTRADGSKVITGCVNFADRRQDLVEGYCQDGHGHGTHVTGTIAAAGGQDGKGVRGVAPGASILSYKVLNDQGRGYADDVARAIRFAADQGAHIISMSLGSSSPSPDELDAIRYANGKGVLVVAAAGNSGPDENTIGYPGGFAEAVAVAALNADESVAYFSSRGITDGNDKDIADREVEVAGPGRSVISTYKDGAYRTMSGTSMATPHIAGLAARMWQGNAERTRAWLRSAAQAHDITVAEQINNAGAGYDIAGGYGLPQVKAATESTWNN